jgi:chemotaxis protein MotB
MKADLTEELSQDENFVSLLDQMVIEMTEDGMRIEMLESENDAFFELGSSVLSQKASKFLELVASKLANFPNKIAIEGHTDSRPLNSGGSYTNYELSTDRANSARRALINGGVSLAQIDEIIGYADRRLRDAKDPYNVINRRISIILKYIDR